MEGKKRTEIAEIGKFGLIERICSRVEPQNASTVKGCGDDTAVIDAGNRYVLLSTELLLEGVHFDLTYYPLQHLGYKAVVAGISDILAMNGTPRQIELALGIPARFSVEMVDRLYDGVRAACDRYRTDLAGGDTTASVNGLAIGVTAAGDVAKDRIAYRSGAKPNDLICLSGDLGAAYMGLHLLEREKRACGGQPDPKPKFEGHEYILGRQLKPEARTDIIERLAEAGIVPTSMIDITDGLASETLHLCKSSGCGARIYLDRLPIARQTHDMAEELHAGRRGAQRRSGLRAAVHGPAIETAGNLRAGRRRDRARHGRRNRRHARHARRLGNRAEGAGLEIAARQKTPPRTKRCKKSNTAICTNSSSRSESF